MPVRKLLFWIHLALGAAAGLVVASLAASGMLMAFEHPIVELAERRVSHVTPPADARRLSPSALVAHVRAARPEARVSGITMQSDPTASAVVQLGREDGLLHVDPYTGNVLGTGSRARDVLHGVEDWHRRLAMGDTGRQITGAACLILMMLVPTGLYLWWPRQWFWFRRGVRGRARDFNWHHVVGLWCAPLLLVTTATGAVMAYPWANDLLFRVAGSEPPPRRPQERRPPRGREAAPALPENLDALWARAEQQTPAWKSISLRLPARDGGIVFFIQDDAGHLPTARAQLALDPATGAVLRWEPYESQSRGRRLRAWVRPVHTGEAGGLLGSSVAFLGAGGALVLVWTGLALSLRRLAEWRSRRARRAAAGRVGESLVEGGAA